MRKQVGILGIGTYLPPEVRRNDWWPSSTVAKWSEKARPRDAAPPEYVSDGQRLASEAMAGLSKVPFRGAVERRVMDKGMKSSDMETAAGKDALARAGVAASEIDLLMTYAFCPDFLMAPNACRVHRQLGLPERCLSLGTESACNSFLTQLALAEELIAGGRYRKALLIQSSSISKVLPYEQPHSAWFGDGATAVVVGPVAEGRGILAQSHQTNGENHRALVIGVPQAAWHDAGEVRIYQDEPRDAVRMMKTSADRSRTAIHDALGRADLGPADVNFYACHQGLSWLRSVTQEYAGLARAKSLDTFAQFASLGAANIPLVLALAEREHMVDNGDAVAMFSAGAGEMWSSVVMRWGHD